VGATLPLSDRLREYRKLVAAHPELSIAERERMFAMAMWPDAVRRRRPVTMEHLMQCRDPHCACTSDEAEFAA